MAYGTLLFDSSGSDRELGLPAYRPIEEAFRLAIQYIREQRQEEVLQRREQQVERGEAEVEQQLEKQRREQREQASEEVQRRQEGQVV